MGKLNDPVRVMKRALRFASKDEGRATLCTVHLSGNGDVVSTDSYRLYVEHGAWAGFELTMKRETAERIAKCKVKGNEQATITRDGDMITVKMGDGTVIEDGIAEGVYPKYTKLFEGLEPRTVIYTGKQLRPVIAEHKRMKQNVRFDVSDRDLTVSGIGTAKPSVRVDKACDGEDNCIGFDPAYIGPALEAFGYEARIHVMNPLKPAIVKPLDGEGAEVLVMPVRMDKATPKRKGAGMRKAPKAPEPKPSGEPLNLKGERVCITGTLPDMTRGEAFTRLRLAGAEPCERFTRKVTLFVIAADAGRSKREKADAAIAKGQKLRIVNGTEFVKALNEQGKTAGERKQEEHVAKKQGNTAGENITVECRGRNFYASHRKGEFITPGGPSERVSFEVGKAYRYREGGREYEAFSLGYDNYKGERKCLFAVFDGDGEWKSYLRTIAWAKLKTLANNPVEPKVSAHCEHEQSVIDKDGKHPKSLCGKADTWTNCREVGHCTISDKMTETAVKPKKEAEGKEEQSTKKQIEELQEQLKAAHKELEEVWKENATLKAKKPKEEPKAAEKQVEQAAEVSLDTMRKWCEERGNMVATQKRDGCPIWVEGETKPHMDELSGMGFRWAPKRKGWYLDVA